MLRKRKQLREIYEYGDFLGSTQQKTMLRCLRMLIAEAEITKLKQQYGLPLDAS